MQSQPTPSPWLCRGLFSTEPRATTARPAEAPAMGTEDLGTQFALSSVLEKGNTFRSISLGMGGAVGMKNVLKY